MGNEKFCLRWNDFESNISIAFRELREDKDFFDVTLACDDDQIQAHKVILSACSPFFRTVLRRNPHNHPLIYLKGVKYTDLQSVLNFMYHGEVNVAQEELNSFLLVAEELRVKGLTQNQTDSSQSSTKPSSAAAPPPPKLETPSGLAVSPPTTATPPHKPRERPRPSPAPLSSYTSAPSPEVQEVLMPPVKSEPLPPGPDETTSLAPLYPDEEQYEEYPEEHYDDTQYGQSQQHGEPNKAPQLKSPADLLNFVETAAMGFQCTICGKTSGSKREARNHVESIHFPSSFVYNCEHCGREFNSLNTRNVHISRHHNRKKDSAAI